VQQKKKDKNVEVISLEKEESEESLGSLEEAQIAEFENSQEFELLKVKNENESLKEKEGALKSAVKESTEKVIEEKNIKCRITKRVKSQCKKNRKIVVYHESKNGGAFKIDGYRTKTQEAIKIFLLEKQR